MQQVNSEALLSPWHDIEIESSVAGDSYVTGVTEITLGTEKKLEVTKSLAFNPVMQDTVVNKITKNRQHRVYSKPPKFGYGFIPQTWCDDDVGGDADAIDLVDLSLKQSKPVLAVADYLVLGIFGLVDQGELDYKVLGIEANEANERCIKNLKDFQRLQPDSIEEIKVWFRDYKTWEGGKTNKFIWNGDVLPAEQAMAIIKESNLAYLNLKTEKTRQEKKNYWMGINEAAKNN